MQSGMQRPGGGAPSITLEALGLVGEFSQAESVNF